MAFYDYSFLILIVYEYNLQVYYLVNSGLAKSKTMLGPNNQMFFLVFFIRGFYQVFFCIILNIQRNQVKRQAILVFYEQVKYITMNLAPKLLLRKKLMFEWND